MRNYTNRRIAFCHSICSCNAWIAASVHFIFSYWCVGESSEYQETRSVQKTHFTTTLESPLCRIKMYTFPPRTFLMPAWFPLQMLLLDHCVGTQSIKTFFRQVMTVYYIIFKMIVLKAEGIPPIISWAPIETPQARSLCSLQMAIQHIFPSHVARIYHPVKEAVNHSALSQNKQQKIPLTNTLFLTP